MSHENMVDTLSEYTIAATLKLHAYYLSDNFMTSWSDDTMPTDKVLHFKAVE